PYSTAGPVGAAAGTAVTVTAAASTSRRMIRPPGPVPRISRRSTPACAAIFLANGDAFTRPVATAVGAVGAGMPTAGALTAGAAGAGVDTTAGRRGGAGAGAALGVGAAEGAERVLVRAEALPAAPTPAAAGAGADASTAAMSSPGSAMTPISVPTGAFSPAGTRTLRSTPAPNASISTSALSVSISARMSPPWIRSPSFLSHLMISPVSIASESSGMTTLVTA